MDNRACPADFREAYVAGELKFRLLWNFRFLGLIALNFWMLRMKYLDLPIGLGVAAAAANWISFDMWAPMSTQIVAFLSILGMGALTALVVMLTLRNPEELNVGEARAVGEALHSLVLRLTAFAVFSINAALLMIAGLALTGHTVVSFETPNFIFRDDFQWALSGLIAFTGIMAVTRLFPVLRGAATLSDINRELIVKGVLRHQARVAEQSDGRIETLQLPSSNERLFRN